MDRCGFIKLKSESSVSAVVHAVRLNVRVGVLKREARLWRCERQSIVHLHNIGRLHSLDAGAQRSKLKKKN